MTTTEIEQRFRKLEQEVAALKAQTTKARPHPIQTLEAIHGIFDKDDPAFDEAMRLGRKWRNAQRPKQRKPKAKRK